MSSIVLPFIFTPNTTIASSQVNANFAALQNAFNTNTRTLLTAPTTFYLSPTGSDTVSGLNPSQPAATFNYLFGLFYSIYDWNNQPVTIQLANGTYAQTAVLRGMFPGQYFQQQLTITGATAGSPNLVTISGSPCFQLNIGASALITNLTMQSTNDCIVAAGGAEAAVSNVIYGPTTNNHLHAIRGGQIYETGNTQINGNFGFHARAAQSSAIFIEGPHALTDPPPANQPTITLTGTPTITGQFVQAGDNSTIDCTAQFVGSATGNRGMATNNGVINTLNNPNVLTTYFPGSVNPTATSGGILT